VIAIGILQAIILPQRIAGEKARMRIALLRHGPTDWNAQGRIQGTLDLPLSEAGQAHVSRLLPPAGFADATAYTSPLIRAHDTATLLGLHPIVDPRLAEHGWGEWEGLTREEILARDGADAFVRAGAGLAFTPPGGERTSDLVARVRSFLFSVAKSQRDAIAVTHRGVLRSAYAIASGWEMLTPMPDALDLSKALVLSLERDGSASIAALNVALEPIITRAPSG
jgi:broad specificity phosphatase PhoE